MAPGGQLFYAMELVRGPTLARYLDGEGRLSEQRALQLIRQVLRGLQAAHDAGVVHSDVKPDNIAIQPPSELTGSGHERAIVFDFGVARLAAAGGQTEAVGASLGYMAPEQATAGRVDNRSDLFSAALILYQMLTGWRRQGLDHLVPPLTPAEIPSSQLLTVLRRALAIDPADRYQHAGELLAALDPGQQQAVEAPPTDTACRWLAPFVEDDRWRFRGRVLATSQLSDLVLFNRVVVLTAIRGAGKTSLLRAGLMPRLQDLRVVSEYVSCRTDPLAAAIEALGGSSRRLDEALLARLDSAGRRVVLCFDHVEALAGGRDATALFEAIGRCLDAAGDDVGVVLSVRSDQLAMLVELRGMLSDAPPVLRLGPLTRAGAQEALQQGLDDARVELCGAASAAALEDLLTAGRELHGGAGEPCYPAHVQALVAALQVRAGDGAELSVDAYRELEPVSAMIATHVRRVLDSTLVGIPVADGRALLGALVGEGGTPIFVPETTLRRLAPGLGRGLLLALADAHLLTPDRTPHRPLAWSLVHELVVPHVLDWILTAA